MKKSSYICVLNLLIADSMKVLFKLDQYCHYSNIFEYFDNPRCIKEIPEMVSRLNLYIIVDGLIRVRSKFGRIKDGKLAIFPILLAKDSILTGMYIIYCHCKLFHAGCYSLLNEVRRQVWIPHHFSVVKRTLKSCVQCKRFNQKPMRLNQSSYREERLNPPRVPFRFMYMDFIGPCFARVN